MKFVSILFCCLWAWQTLSIATEDEQIKAIIKLGELNGIALHCNALPETQRMKRALVLKLPKRKQLGDLFDYETNKSFMNFIHKNATCPKIDELIQQVDQSIQELEHVYDTP